MSDLVVGLTLVLVIEGVLYAVFPNAMRRMVEDLAKLPDNSLRMAGLVALVAGVFIVWLVRG